MTSPILITGGAGYIGSHIVHNLRDHGHEVVVLDNLGNSRPDLIVGQATLVTADVLDTETVKATLHTHGIKTVIHMAAFLSVEESVAQPLKYYRNNVDGTRSLLEACVECGVEKLIFSSTGATYASSEVPLRETDPQEPTSPYGASKAMAERMIHDVANASQLKAVILRYFNVAGADPRGRTGQQGVNATHLISRACQAAAGDREAMFLYGTDYATPDGTCVRDYIHVSDLAEAHRVVMTTGFAAPVTVFNGGYGSGFSVAQVIDRVKAITGRDFKVVTEARRPGDLAQTVADNNALLNQTRWRPQYDDLDLIIRTAWDWYQRERVLAALASC